MPMFKIVEIMDLGIEKEKRRRDFYDIASKKFENKELTELFTKLRDWEDGHVRKYTAIREKVAEEEVKDEEYEGEFESYVKAFIDDYLSQDMTPESFSEKFKEAVDAVEYAKGFEKNAILFFMELAKYLEGHNKEVIEQLKDEEKQHLAYLENIRKKLTK